jgi:hypothetical protein
VPLTTESLYLLRLESARDVRSPHRLSFVGRFTLGSALIDRWVKLSTSSNGRGDQKYVTVTPVWQLTYPGEKPCPFCFSQSSSFQLHYALFEQPYRLQERAYILRIPAFRLQGCSHLIDICYLLITCPGLALILLPAWSTATPFHSNSVLSYLQRYDTWDGLLCLRTNMNPHTWIWVQNSLLSHIDMFNQAFWSQLRRDQAYTDRTVRKGMIVRNVVALSGLNRLFLASYA